MLSRSARPLGIGFALTLALQFSACAPARSSRDGGHDDGGQGGQGGGSAGAGGGAAGAGGGGGAGACAEGERVCDGANVRACSAGKPSGPVIESCAGGSVCAGGHCTSAACADAEAKKTFVGCRFFTFDIDNTDGFDDMLHLMLILGNPSDTATAKVVVERREPGMPWVTDMAATLAPGGVETMRFADRHHEGAGLGAALAWRVISDSPIVAYHVQSDDQDKNPLGGGSTSETTGGTMLVPQHALGRSYMAITYQQKTTDLTMRYMGITSSGQVAVVGTADGTKVTFKLPSTGSSRAGGGAPAKGPGESFDVTIDEGDVFQIYSASEGDDLTGTEVTSDRPIAVFSGNIATSYGKTAGTDIQSADMTHEQMIPLSAWGKSYVASRLLPQQPCTGGGKANTSLWRILASEDGTKVSFDVPAKVTGVPTAPVMLDRGKFTELSVGGPAGADGDFFISADKPVLVAQFPACEPALALAVSAEQLLQDFLFVTPPIFEHQIAVVRKSGTAVTLDGVAITDAMFTSAGGGFEVARLALPSCAGMISTCGHRIKGTDIGVALRGQDTICGYAFSGGMAVRCVNKTVGCF